MSPSERTQLPLPVIVAQSPYEMASFPKVIKILDMLRYTIVSPWDSLKYSLRALTADPPRVVHQWRELKKAENLLIGLVVIISFLSPDFLVFTMPSLPANPQLTIIVTIAPPK
jgi:hypothetical protein